MKIVLYDMHHGEEWNDYVARSPAATFCHQIEWRSVISSALRHRPRYLAARERDVLCGILPLFLIASKVVGRCLVSLPWLDYGGPVADSPEVEQALVRAAIRLADRHRCQFVELRCMTHLPLALAHRTHKATFLLDLTGGTDHLWEAFDPKLRNQIRKGEKAGLRVSFGREDHLDRFYPIFAQNMRDLGTPVWGRSLFQQILHHMGDRSEIVLVEQSGNAIAGGLLLFYRDTAIVPAASSLRSHRHLCPNNLMYWRILKRAIGRGCQMFDFGRSSYGSGTYRFKIQWGGWAVPLCWQYYLNGRGTVPGYGSDSSDLAWASKLWKKVPVPVATILGPHIVRHIP